MGNGASHKARGVLYIKYNNKVQRVEYDRGTSCRDLEEQLAVAVGLSRLSNIVLKGTGGDVILAISPTMASNSRGDAYTVEQAGFTTGANDVIASTVKEIGKQFRQAFMVEETKKDIYSKVSSIENRVEKDGKRLVEMEKYKLDLVELRDALYNRETNSLDYNRLRPSFTRPDYFYCPSTEREAIITMERDIPEFMKYTLSNETKEQLKTPHFDVWQWEPNEMLALLEEMYYELGLVEELQIHPSTLKRFLLRVQENYRNNPFHNFRHSFCVTQMMYVLIHGCRLPDVLSKRDLCVLLTACVCHDLDHPGYNNTYQINARTELAVRYNDMSPLENHHCAVSFKILSCPECNIFTNLTQEEFKEVRGDMIILILATDMARHAEILDNFRQKIDAFDYSSEDHLNTLKMILIKACDISNECRPIMVSEGWVDCLMEEYFHQSDKEKRDQLPVAPFMDRDRVTKPSAQIGFIKYVLLPLFEALSKLYPEVEQIALEHLRLALTHYERKSEATQSDDKKKKVEDGGQ